MKREIVTTADGSATIFLPEWNEHYHSKHGALQEAYHVFMKTGLDYFIEISKPTAPISILEMGFGSGLNCLISLLEAQKKQISIEYTGVEAYPVSMEELEKLNYPALFREEDAEKLFRRIHEAEWGQNVTITNFFSLVKRQAFFKSIEEVDVYDLIFFDAFGPRVQPKLWTEEMFGKMFKALRSGGVLVTYSAKGSVRRAMEAVGFSVERLPGPPGKREMLRASRR